MSNQNMLVSQCTLVQLGSISSTNPFVFNYTSGLVFSGNSITSIDGSPTFTGVHDALFLNNHFTRNAANQYGAIIMTHRFVMDFAYRIAVIDNLFDVTDGPITNTTRNDGETMLTEGGEGSTDNLGTVTAAGSSSLTDSNNSINVNPFGSGIPGNYGVAIVSGTGAGQTREVTGYSSGTLQVDHPWDVIPDSSSHYATFVWGLEKSLLIGNTLNDNPRGIWLYQTSVRDVDILNNTINNGGGIYLKAFQSQAAKRFDSQYNIRIAGNSVSNANSLWMSYVDVLFTNVDTAPFGTAFIGIEAHNNTLTANVPNVTTILEDSIHHEGYTNMLSPEGPGGSPGGTLNSAIPEVLATILQSSRCNNCDTAFTIGSGDYGTDLIDLIPAGSLANLAILGASFPAAVGTVSQ
jgi:hypothetical protein